MKCILITWRLVKMSKIRGSHVTFPYSFICFFFQKKYHNRFNKWKVQSWTCNIRNLKWKFSLDFTVGFNFQLNFRSKLIFRSQSIRTETIQYLCNCFWMKILKLRQWIKFLYPELPRSNLISALSVAEKKKISSIIYFWILFSNKKLHL